MASTSTDSPDRPPVPTTGIAASMAACCTHPLDVMRVRLQTASTKTSLSAAVKDTVAHKGIRGLYTGLTASIFRQMTYSLTRLGAYDVIKDYMSNNGAKKLNMAELTFCASSAGALGGLAGNPADVVLVRMISDPAKPLAQQLHYRNAAHGVYRMVADEGFLSLFRGLLPNTVRGILMNSAQLVSYDTFKSLLTSYGMEDGLPLHFVASAMAGTVATTICSPADVIKSRVMHSRDPLGPLHVITTSLKNEGPKFMFKGWLPSWIRLTPNTICMFVFLEQLRHVVDFVREPKAVVPATLK
ncbi:Mitochondrial dicarboxylate transporter [Apiotrichum porosum]|uniref:Mitochondrial dicarboxylate transporter n=1 Tax=Apiotrichum porosum TaxID=105984 RepID=A0A427XX03_9TREE|nr:Mitochondrial dicarboxylate transporter [Apiotrichum porosum]RSH83370.1 Mitochondrial dicarboxylate transporter [Apiotrichum porosum]